MNPFPFEYLKIYTISYQPYRMVHTIWTILEKMENMTHMINLAYSVNSNRQYLG